MKVYLLYLALGTESSDRVIWFVFINIIKIYCSQYNKNLQYHENSTIWKNSNPFGLLDKWIKNKILLKLYYIFQTTEYFL